MRDKDLDWKLRPNADDEWGNVRVKINSKGLVGPELDYSKRPGIKRILYLGDSVTFGYRMKRYNLSFPYHMEYILEHKLNYEIETVNASVGGYSPWQEYIVLSTEGIKYDPDLVVVSFVLNDVTAKLGLLRFGGTGEGFQLDHSVTGTIDRLAEVSGIFYFAKRISARIRFGSNIQQGARQREAMDVADVVYNPTHEDIQEAWQVTLQDLGNIFDYAKEKDLPIVLAIFPFSFQFYDVENRSTPQRILRKFAADNNVPVIDLLPILFRRLKTEGAKPESYFMDPKHLSERGHEVVAEVLADFILSEKLLADGKIE